MIEQCVTISHGWGEREGETETETETETESDRERERESHGWFCYSTDGDDRLGFQMSQ